MIHSWNQYVQVDVHIWSKWNIQWY